MLDSTAAHAHEIAAAQNRAAALACIERLERDVRAAQAEARLARLALTDQRRRLARIHRDAKRGAACAREPFAQLLLGSIAIVADAP